MSDRYDIRYAEQAADDIRCLRVFDQRALLDGIEQYLAHQPGQVSKSRIKAMAQPFWSHFRLRIGDFRTYYDVDEERRAVNVLRVLKKTTQPTPEEPT
ncbi:MAG: type II toxin-antitoxin system RelE/ParE family toxin [bacterium]